MKLIRHIPQKTGASYVLLPQDNEDIWFVYNLLQEGDEVETMTTRKLVNEKNQPRIKLKLRIKIAKIELDLESGIIRLNGKTVTDHKDVPMNSFHTLQLEPDLPFELYKEEWDSFASKLIEDSCNIENRSDLAAVVLQPGLAHICLVTDAMTILRQKIEVTIPKKRRDDNSNQEKATQKFFGQIYQALKTAIPLDKIKVVLLASPGQTATQLKDYINTRCLNERDENMIEQRKKFVTGHSSSGHLHALQEALKDDQLTQLIANTRYGKETKIMDDFFTSLNNDDLKAWYGLDEVRLAIKENAIQTLMITDQLFRSSDIEERKRYIELCEEVESLGREVLVFSSLHASGEQLNNVSGVACMLMYPLDLDDLDEE